MSNLMTTWGYKLFEMDSLPALLTEEEFHAMTAGKYAGDARIEFALKAASAAVRNYCGWHLTPSATCIFSETLLYGNGRVKQVNNDLLIQLPAAVVESIVTVAFDGAEMLDYSLQDNGILHVFGVPALDVSRKSKVTVTYVAGIPDGMLDGIKEIVKERAVHGLSATTGVTSETAGGVSVSYANAWVAGGGSGALSTLDKEMLDPYKLTGVF